MKNISKYFLHELKTAQKRDRRHMMIDAMLKAGYPSLAEWARQHASKRSTISMAIDRFCLNQIDEGILPKQILIFLVAVKSNATNATQKKRVTAAIRHLLSKRGYLSISEWARQHGYKPDTVIKDVNRSFWMQNRYGQPCIRTITTRFSAITRDIAKTLEMRLW